jgi:hypothetical protein
MSIKGYKGFDKDLKCRRMQYEVGKTYEMDEDPVVCSRGFHFCERIIDVHEYYKLGDSRICEIEAIGKVEKDGNKSSTNKILIIRELSREEIRTLGNVGTDNTGYGNSGDGNSGEFNSCNNSAGVFMTRRISFEAFNKALTEDEYNELISSPGFRICKNFSLCKYRVRTQTGKFGDFRYMGYKSSWRVYWSKLSFADRNYVRQMPHLDKDVFYEITGVKL